MRWGGEGGNNPVNVTDPDGRCFTCLVLGGAVIGFVGDVTYQLIKTGDVNWKQAGVATLAGAAAGAAVGAAIIAGPTIAVAILTHPVEVDKIGKGIVDILNPTPESALGGKTVKAARGADEGVSVFRVYGGKAKPNGFSWTSVNPSSVENFRSAAGLPNSNTGRFVIEGTVKGSNIIKSRRALPLDGNKGGILEYIIDPKNVNINKVSGANPNF